MLGRIMNDALACGLHRCNGFWPKVLALIDVDQVGLHALDGPQQLPIISSDSWTEGEMMVHLSRPIGPFIEVGYLVYRDDFMAQLNKRNTPGFSKAPEPHRACVDDFHDGSNSSQNACASHLRVSCLESAC